MADAEEETQTSLLRNSFFAPSGFTFLLGSGVVFTINFPDLVQIDERLPA